MPISAHEINIKLAMKHGYGHGGKMANNIPLIGLENLAQSSRFQYVCNTCMTGFPFEHRGNHLGGDEHYINYLVCLFSSHVQGCQGTLKTLKNLKNGKYGQKTLKKT